MAHKLGVGLDQVLPGDHAVHLHHAEPEATLSMARN